MLCTMLFALGTTALASPTGATPEEIAVYHSTGYAGHGLPSHAVNTLGNAKGASFVAAKVVTSQIAAVVSGSAAGPVANVVVQVDPVTNEITIPVNWVDREDS